MVVEELVVGITVAGGALVVQVDKVVQVVLSLDGTSLGILRSGGGGGGRVTGIERSITSGGQGEWRRTQVILGR